MPSNQNGIHKRKRISGSKYTRLLNRSIPFLTSIFVMNGFFQWRCNKDFRSSMDHNHSNKTTAFQHVDQKQLKIEKNCSSYHPWQDISIPTCNNVHEIDLGQMMHVFIKEGGFRSVWKLSLSEGEAVALKTIILQKDRLFRYDVMQNQRLDALISEKLTSSEYILNIFQYCGYSGVYEFGFDGNLEDNYHYLNDKERLQTSFDIARGLADLHGLIDEVPIIHSDIAVRQFIFIDGKYKLNDFNKARMPKSDKADGTICPSYRYKRLHDKNRAPEEMIHNEEKYLLTEKIDVYSLGNIFYKLLMNHRKWDGLSEDSAVEKIINGSYPEMRQMNDPVMTIFIDLFWKCFDLEPKKRPAAIQIADTLAALLNETHSRM